MSKNEGTNRRSCLESIKPFFVSCPQPGTTWMNDRHPERQPVDAPVRRQARRCITELRDSRIETKNEGTNLGSCLESTNSFLIWIVARTPDFGVRGSLSGLAREVSGWAGACFWLGGAKERPQTAEPAVCATRVKNSRNEPGKLLRINKTRF